MTTTCSTPAARASWPIFSQYRAEALSSPSIMVEPWEKKWTGAALSRGLLFPTAILILSMTTIDAQTGGILATRRGPRCVMDLKVRGMGRETSVCEGMAIYPPRYQLGLLQTDRATNTCRWRRVLLCRFPMDSTKAKVGGAGTHSPTIRTHFPRFCLYRESGVTAKARHPLLSAHA